MLRSVCWLNTDVSRLPMGPIFKINCPRTLLRQLTLEDGTDSPETSLLNQTRLRNIPEDNVSTA